jgi:peptide/nickel transport system permease protein
LARYVVRRAIQSVFLLLGVTFIGFAIMRVAPGGPSLFLGGEDNPRVSAEYRRQIAEAFGLNDPLPIQYVKWLWNVLHLDFGRSYIDQRPVMDKIAERIPASFQLGMSAYLLGLFGIPLGVYAATHHRSVGDQAIRVATALLNCVPHWWLGIVILVLLHVPITLFGFTIPPLRLFPLGGQYTPGVDTLPDRLWHLALPALLMSLGGWIGYSRIIRAELLDVLGQDYMRTAHAKGLGARYVMIWHGLRNALMPLAPSSASIIGVFLTGSLLFEITFSWPGLGRLTVDAAYQRDYPLLMASLLIGSFVSILANLLSDVTYGWVDPRVRYD